MKLLLYILLTITVLNARSESTDLHLDKGLKELTKSLPQRFDALTTLDAAARFNNKIRYIYTVDGKLDGMNISDFLTSKSFISELANDMEKISLNYICTTPGTKLILELGYEIQYVYYDKDYKYLFKFQAKEKDCKDIEWKEY